MEIPADELFHQILHEPERGDPGAVNRFLVVDDIGRGIELDSTAFAEEGDFAPFAGGTDDDGAGGVVAGAVDGAFNTLALGESFDVADAGRAAEKGFVAEAEVKGKLDALGHDIETDDCLRAELAGERGDGETDRAETSNKDGIGAADTDFLQTFESGAEAAGDLRAVSVREFRRESDEVLFFSEKVVGHATIALPAVGAPEVLAGAGDGVAAAAIVAETAARDVINDDAIALVKTAATRPGRDDLAAGFMSGYDALVAFRDLCRGAL